MKFKHYHLEIPGTHGTWPKRIDWKIERGGMYLTITRPLWQRTWVVVFNH